MERSLATAGVLVSGLSHALLPRPLSVRLAGRIRSSRSFHTGRVRPKGVAPERPYTKEELQTYLDHGRRKCRATIEALTEESGRERCRFEWVDVSVAELLLYNMRHVQHHAAQLNLILRQQTDSAPRWVAQAKSEPGGEKP